MPRETLLGLAADVDRLLAAGAPAAAGNERLGQRGGRLRALGQKVPALVPVADAVGRLSGAEPKKAAPALLELAQTSRQLRASLAGHGVAGELEPLPESGPWRTPLAVRDARLLNEVLSGGGSNREDELRA